MPNLIEEFDTPIPTVSINAYGIIFNSACIEILDKPEFVAIGVDRKKRMLAIKPLKKDKKAFRCYPYSNKDKTYLTVRSTKLIHEIERLNINLDDEKLYPATFNVTTGILVVDLKDE